MWRKTVKSHYQTTCSLFFNIVQCIFYCKPNDILWLRYKISVLSLGIHIELEISLWNCINLIFVLRVFYNRLITLNYVPMRCRPKFTVFQTKHFTIGMLSQKLTFQRRPANLKSDIGDKCWYNCFLSTFQKRMNVTFLLTSGWNWKKNLP